MTYYAIIDTNVIISAMLNPDSIPGMVLKYTLAGVIVPYINKEIFKEYSEVIYRDKFGFDRKDIELVLNQLQEKAIDAERTQTNAFFTDKKDIVFYEVTLTARTKTNAYLITGNIKHFPKETFIVTPKEMIDIISKDK